MANQLKKKFIQDGAIDGLKLELLEGQAVKLRTDAGQVVNLLELNQDEKILLKGEEAALKSQVDAEQTRASEEESRIEGKVDQEVQDRQSEITRVDGRIDNVISNIDPSALDSLSEVVSAFQDADGNLETSITNLSTTAAADRALIRSEFAAADADLQSNIDAEEAARQSADTNLQNQITSVQGAGDTLFEDDSSVYADATAPIEDPTGRDGWYYKSAGSPDKINWYFFDGSQTQVTVGQLQNMYTVATVDSASTDTFHLAYYTIPLGDGNDAGSWYRSRQVFVPVEPFQRGEKALFWVKNQPDASVYPNLPRVQMQPTTVAGSSVGLNDDSELLLTTVFGTNSAADANSIELVVNKLGIESSVYNKEYTLEIRGEFTLAGIKQSLLEESIERQNADSVLQENIDVEKARIDAILLASDADKDSFAEIVTLINSVDTENDAAFAGYVTSNDARVLAVEGEVDVLQGEMDAAEGRLDVLESVVFFKEKYELTSTDIANGFITLSHTPESNSMSAFVDRLAIHEGVNEDYTISGTTMTFLNDLVGTGTEKLQAGDNIYVKYQYKA